MGTRLTPIAEVVPDAMDRVTGRAEPEDRHVAFLRRHARVARNNRAPSIAVELEAIADRLDRAVRAGQLIRLEL